MTLPNLTSPPAELIAYRDELKAKIVHLRNFSAAYPDDSYPLKLIRHYEDEAIEVLDELNRRESCQHPGLTDGTCSGCGLPADQLPFMTTTHWRECAHEDFTENLEGRTCRECGLETK